MNIIVKILTKTIDKHRHIVYTICRKQNLKNRKEDRPMNRFVLNETSYFGAGSREAIAEEVARKGLNKALIVTDNSLVKFGVVSKVSEVLEKAGIPFEIFENMLAYKCENVGIKTAARIAITAITITSSTIVKPFLLFLLIILFGYVRFLIIA